MQSIFGVEYPSGFSYKQANLGIPWFKHVQTIISIIISFKMAIN
jgi:hypothetical protein